MANQQDIGLWGETIATEYLESRGYIIFDKNYRFGKGEIDIVAFIPHEIVFVEVKTRSNTQFDYPERAITPTKKQLLIQTAEAYLYERKLETVPARFDVISIGLDNPQNPDIQHFVDAFR
ncbi:MAG: YraN family protein [Bacteroidia bacterium]|nr:YraN family protein [Bacteroidia bacterium]